MEMYRGFWEMRALGLELARNVVREAGQDRPAQVTARRPGRAGRALARLSGWIASLSLHL